MAERAAAIEVDDLHKHFGTTTALGGVHLSVAEGDFLTVFGPNGAGKTTLMRILSTLARASRGTVRIFGTPTHSASAAIRSRIGLVTHRSLLYPTLSAHANVSFFAAMFGVSRPADRAAELLSALGLEHRMHDAVATYSRGMEQRCAIARALVHEPDVLLLDEPFSGLDFDARRRLAELLSAGESSRTVVLTSHNLSHGVELADRVAILARGRVVFEAATAELPAAGMEAVYQQHIGSRR